MTAGKAFHRIEIRYCAKCRFILRAGWLAQELLMTFNHRLTEVALMPGENGVFDIYLNNEKLFSKQETGHFPESKELKQVIRNKIAPDMALGHSDK